MYEKLKSQFYELIIDEYNSYTQRLKKKESGVTRDLRASINMATILYHFRERFPNELKKSRRELALIYPDYNILGDIVNSVKHNIISNNNPQVNNSDSIFEEFILTFYNDVNGNYWIGDKRVVVVLNNGIKRDLLEINTNILNMWIDILNQLNVIQNIKQFKYIKSIEPRKREKRSISIEAFSGIQFKKTIVFQKYNYENKSIEPIDLEQFDDIRMTIYKQLYEIDLIFSNETIKSDVKITINVDEEVKERLSKIKIKEKFVIEFLKIAKSQGVIKDFKE